MPPPSSAACSHSTASTYSVVVKLSKPFWWIEWVTHDSPAIRTRRPAFCCFRGAIVSSLTVQPTHEITSLRVELAEDRVLPFVDRCVRRIGDELGRGRIPGRDIDRPNVSHGKCGKESVAVRGTDGRLAHDLGAPCDIRGRLGPDAIPGAAAHGENRPRVLPDIEISVDYVPRPAGNAFEHGAEEVAAGVRKVQTEDDAPGAWIIDRGALARE